MFWIKVQSEHETAGNKSNPGLIYASNHELPGGVHAQLTPRGRAEAYSPYSMDVMGAKRWRGRAKTAQNTQKISQRRGQKTATK